MANNQSVRRHLDAFTRGRIIGKLEEGRSVKKCGSEFELLTASFHDFGDNFKTTGTAIRGQKKRRQTAGEIAKHTTQATGRPISRFTVARRLHGGGLFARRPVRCVPLTPAHRRRRSLWCREHRNWRDNEWGRVLFTDESRFSLSRDSHRILIWREREAAIIPRTSLKGTGMEVAVFSFGEASCLVVVQTFTSSTQVQSTGPVIVTRFFFRMCVFLEVLWVCSSFSWTTMHHVIVQ
ncbi:transposable element Tc1 transposase [Trichonephila clavipes]|nr:transposable element Tc1 transposase [Trichonephila clavipes]